MVLFRFTTDLWISGRWDHPSDPVRSRGGQDASMLSAPPDLIAVTPLPTGKVAVVRSPPEQNYGVHKDLTVGAYNLTKDGQTVPFLETQTSKEYVSCLFRCSAEIQCKEESCRQFINRWCMDRNGGNVVSQPLALGKLAPTVPNCMEIAFTHYASQPCVGARPIYERQGQIVRKGPYYFRTYAEVHANIVHAAHGLMQLPGVAEKRQRREKVYAAILAPSSQEWMIAANAAWYCGITIATTDSKDPASVKHVLDSTGAEIAFVDWSRWLNDPALKNNVLANAKQLRHIIFIGKDLVPWTSNQPFPDPRQAASLGAIGEKAHCTTVLNLVLHGMKPHSIAPTLPEPFDEAIVIFEAGRSNGPPAGVVLSHRNLVAGMTSPHGQLLEEVPRVGDRVMVFVPPSSILGLMVELFCIFNGAAVGYAQHSTLFNSSKSIQKEKGGQPSVGYESDILALQPTIIVANSSGLQELVHAIKAQVGVGKIGKLLQGATERLHGEHATSCYAFSCLDRGVVQKVKKDLGVKNVRLFISGTNNGTFPHLNNKDQELLQAVIAPVSQVFGFTESAGCCTMQLVPINFKIEESDRQDNYRGGCIQAACDIKLKTVPNTDYTTKSRLPVCTSLLSALPRSLSESCAC